MSTNVAPVHCGRKRGAAPSHNVRLSRALAYLLRHGAEKEGLPLRPDGFVPVSALFAVRSLKGFTLEDVRECVETNDKQRFQLREDDGVLLIKANQGHSIAVNELDLAKIIDPAEIPVVIHGTDAKLWDSIVKNGLSKMGRNHIHFAVGRLGENGVTSGMRTNCTLFIQIDVPKAIKDGIEFFRSANNVVLSPGREGIIGQEYFLRVEDAAGRPFRQWRTVGA